MKTENSTIKIDRRIIDEIVQAIQGIEYGEVTIILHDSKVVQIEKKEKKRFGEGVMLFKK